VSEFQFGSLATRSREVSCVVRRARGCGPQSMCRLWAYAPRAARAADSRAVRSGAVRSLLILKSADC